ncbi:hypothetical protein BGP_5093 [Beggiatoa sp. PS]|nr:hypothetical protein BGP_5093 [Beggiatoa sp. PS]
MSFYNTGPFLWPTPSNPSCLFKLFLPLLNNIRGFDIFDSLMTKIALRCDECRITFIKNHEHLCQQP